MPDFLLEIGLEEIPARMIASAQAELLKRTLALLTRERLLLGSFDPVADAKSFSTPRRLAVYIKNVEPTQAPLMVETLGPSTKVAYRDGQPSPAAIAFAKKMGIDVASLRQVMTAKGEYLQAISFTEERTASEVLATELPKEIAAIYFPKNMYWREHKPERFVRPVLWLACLLGDEVVPLTFAGKTAGRATYGHRVLSSGDPFEIVSPQSYLAQLEGEYVIADVELRRQKIRKALDKVTRAIPNARWREDEALVDAVTHLTEWPDVLLGNFEPAYLTLPEEVLVTVMRDHQKYFAVEDAQGKLAPHFLTVTNIMLDEVNAPIIKQGNERVLRARFNDARFFWEFDQRVPLTARVKLLENVTFQKDLGSYAKKSERVLEICRRLEGLAEARGLTVNHNALMDAARLAKTDLTTELVKEFTELQGIIGGLYCKAEADQNPRLAADKERVEITWQAIYDQYLPASASDAVPRSVEGAILGIADRIDTISCMFGLGMEPTGSKDPFALRRAANAVVSILVESKTRLPLLLSEVINAAMPKPAVSDRLRVFFSERIDFYLRERHLVAYDVVKATMAAGADNLPDLIARANAVAAARGSEDFIAISAAFKRMKNILVQATATNNEITSFEPVFPTEEETKLWTEIGNAGAGYLADCKNGSYVEALNKLAKLRPGIDRYFETVMVMTDDLEVRANRLGMLRYLVRTFTQIADFSEIVTAG